MKKDMRYYPINLDIRDRACLVVGGGAVGARKVKTLLDCGAKVTVVSPKIDARLTTWACTMALRLKRRNYRQSDMEGIFLVIGATDDEALNMRISQDAERLGKLCNIADRPAVCNFILPAIVSRGDLTIAVSTSGQSPAFAKKIRKDLSRQYGPEYAQALRLMGAVRRRLLSARHAPEAHKPLFTALIEGDLLDLLAGGDTEAVNQLLTRVLGAGYRYEDLVPAPQTASSTPQQGCDL